MWNVLTWVFLAPALVILGYARLLQIAREQGRDPPHHPELVGLLGLLLFAGAFGSMYQDCNESAAKREREEDAKRTAEDARARAMADDAERRKQAEEKSKAEEEKQARADIHPDRRTKGTKAAGASSWRGVSGRGRRRAGSGAEAPFKSLLVTIGVERAPGAARRGCVVGEGVWGSAS